MDATEARLDDTEKRVAPLELFFDLVFVFALTQVTLLMSNKPTWEGLGEGMLVLTALWWAWGAYAWLTNYIAADEGLERLLMFAAMGAFLITALAVPEAFGDDALLLAIDLGGPLVFGIRGFRVSAGHFAERFALIVIIALGESIVAIGAGLEGEVDGGVLVAAGVGLTIACGLWGGCFGPGRLGGGGRCK